MVAWNYFICKYVRVDPKEIARLSANIRRMNAQVQRLTRQHEAAAAAAAKRALFVKHQEWVRQLDRQSAWAKWARQQAAAAETQKRALFMQHHKRLQDAMTKWATSIAVTEAKKKALVAKNEAWAAGYTAKFLETTQRLQPAQRNRLNLVLGDWEARAQVDLIPAPKRQTAIGRFIRWLKGTRQRRREGLQLYLADAHTHNAVARKELRGRRWWFENWRRHALVALQNGFDPDSFISITRSLPVRLRRRNALRPGQRPVRRFHTFLKRLRHVIDPNAPGITRLHTSPVLGGGLPQTT